MTLPQPNECQSTIQWSKLQFNCSFAATFPGSIKQEALGPVWVYLLHAPRIESVIKLPNLHRTYVGLLPSLWDAPSRKAAHMISSTVKKDIGFEAAWRWAAILCSSRPSSRRGSRLRHQKVQGLKGRFATNLLQRDPNQDHPRNWTK